MSETVTQRTLAIGGLVVLTLLAGCLSVGVETTINSEGEVEELTQEIEIEDQFLWAAFQDEEGSDTGEGEFTDDFDEDNWDSIDTEVFEDEQRIVITATGGDPDAETGFLGNISVSVDDDTGEVTFRQTEGLEIEEQAGDEDELFDDDEIDLEEDLSAEFVVNMPGEVTDTNGDIVDDNTVRWTLEDHGGEENPVETLEATSEQHGDDEGTGGSDDEGTGDGDEGTDGSDDEGTGGSDDGSGPGFGAVVVVSALVVALALLGLRRGSR